MKDPLEAKETILAPEQIQYFDDRYYKFTITDSLREILLKFHPQIKEYQTATEDFFTSSTTILGIVNKPFLYRWRGDLGNELADFKSKKAALTGSVIHDAVHKLITFETSNTGSKLDYSSYSQEEWVQIMRFVEWYDIFKPEILCAELTVLNYEHRYAGTLDMLCYIKEGTYSNGGKTSTVKLKGGIYVGDLKTGKSIGSTAHYQTASYANAVQVMTNGSNPKLMDIEGTFVLHTQASTAKKWSFADRTKAEVESDFDIFLASKKVWDAENPTPKPTQLVMPSEIQLQKYINREE